MPSQVAETKPTGRPVAVLGLGEAGGAFAAHLSGRAPVRGYDPRVVRRTGYPVAASAAECIAEAPLVLSFAPAHDATEAFAPVLASGMTGRTFVDFSTSSPAQKRALAANAEAAGIAFVEASIMAPVTGDLGTVPVIMCGPAAREVAARLRGWGLNTTAIDGPVGTAATRKLVRSIVIKGLTAALIEAARSAEAQGELEFFEQLLDELPGDLTRLRIERYLTGTLQHSARRVDEMLAAAQMVAETGAAAEMSAATARVLQSVPTEGIPGRNGDGRQ